MGGRYGEGDMVDGGRGAEVSRLCKRVVLVARAADFLM